MEGGCDRRQVDAGRGVRCGADVPVLSCDDADRTDESVALTNDGFEEARLVCMVSESCPDFAHNVVHAALGVDEEIGAPELSDDLLAADQLVSSSHKQDQELHGFFFKSDTVPATAKLVSAEVELDLICCSDLTAHEASIALKDPGLCRLRRYTKEIKT